MGRPTLRDELLQYVPADGSTIGNGRLREQLEWETEKYIRVRDEAVRDGILRLGRGRGGAVSRTSPSAPGPVEVEKPASKEPKREIDLYPGFMRGLQTWAANQGWTSHFVEQVSHQGRRNTGGNWTRPDFVVVGARKYDYTPGIVRDVETFEVKPATCDIAAVFEAAAHSRFATKSHLAIAATPETLKEDLLARIESECQRFGLGLILFTNPADTDSWDYRADAIRSEPDPDLLERFINDQISEKEKLRRWLR